MTDPIVPTEPAVEVKSGWKTTEAWMSMILLGALATAGQQLLDLMPVILANPSMPPWVAPLGPVAIVGLGWVMKLVVNNYTKARVALKLPVADVSSAVAAGAAAANAGKQATLDAGNR